LLSILALAGMMWGSVTPARACSCAPGSKLAESKLAEVISFTFERNSLVILGAVAASDSDRMQIDVETVYDGQPVKRITLNQPADPGYSGDVSEVELLGGDCSYTLLGEPGERYLLALKPYLVDGAYTPEGCTSWSMRLIEGDEALSRYFEAVIEAATGGLAPSPVEESDEADFPWLVAAIAATLGPLAFLAGAAFLWRRGG